MSDSDQHNQQKSDTENVSSNTIKADGSSTVGVDRSSGETVTGAGAPDFATPVGFLTYAVKQLPVLVWAIGVGGMLAIIAIVSLWHVPAMALIFGSIGLFIGMFGLVIFATLLMPVERPKPPVVSVIVLYCFAFIFTASGFLGATSLFFDWPIPFRSRLLPAAPPPAAPVIQSIAADYNPTNQLLLNVHFTTNALPAASLLRLEASPDRDFQQRVVAKNVTGWEDGQVTVPVELPEGEAYLRIKVLDSQGNDIATGRAERFVVPKRRDAVATTRTT